MARTAFRIAPQTREPGSDDGAWWPRSRSLANELPGFFADWPSDVGRIQRILYSPPDWDDHPHSVAVAGRTVKTGSFPHDDTHQLTITMGDRTRRTITVIPPGTDPYEAHLALQAITEAVAGSRLDDHPEWENEGGHV